MVEIYNDDAWIGPNVSFARTKEEIEAFQSQFNISSRYARLIASQAWALDFVSKLTRVSIFLGDYAKRLWAGFAPPDSYYSQRPFSSDIAPSLGSIEHQEALADKLKSMMIVSDKTTADEGAVLLALIETTIHFNKEIRFCMGRQRQFIAG